MRILETCTAAWPVPDMQPRIDAFKEAFSADSSRPFELKRTFPYGSPSSTGTFQPSPSPDGRMGRPTMMAQHESHGQTAQLSYNVQPMTPPVSAGFDTSKDPLSMSMMSSGQQQQLPIQTSSMGVEWNPAPIFKYVSVVVLYLQLILTARQLLEYCIRAALSRHGFNGNSYAPAIVSPPLHSLLNPISNHTLSPDTTIIFRTAVFCASRYAIALHGPDRTATTGFHKPCAFICHVEHVARHRCQHV